MNLTLPANTTITDHPSLIWTPSFWDPRKAYLSGWEPDLEAALVEGMEYRQRNQLRSADELINRGEANVVAMLTDMQHDFTDFADQPGRLPVTGTCDIALRLG